MTSGNQAAAHRTVLLGSVHIASRCEPGTTLV